jgi:G8 domain
MKVGPIALGSLALATITLALGFVALIFHTEADHPYGAVTRLPAMEISNPVEDACASANGSGLPLRGPFERQGHAFIVSLPDLEQTSDAPEAPERSPYILCEDGQPVGRAHRPHDAIRKVGNGQFSHWTSALYFSTSDNSDPNDNGRDYRLVAPSLENYGLQPPIKEERKTFREATAHTYAHTFACTSVYTHHAVPTNLPTSIDVQHVKLAEHDALARLTPDCAATTRARRSGRWSDYATWENGRLPSEGARVIIPAGTNVQYDISTEKIPLDWIRVDGRLSFSRDRDTVLAIGTLIVSDAGALEIGTAEAPIGEDVKARIDFIPRVARNRSGDPFDLAGGLLSNGIVVMAGAPKTPRAVTQSLRRADGRIQLKEAAHGWKIGDQILIPGTDPWYDEDELRTIQNLSAEKTAIEIDRPLAFNHQAPDNLPIWLGNLTRSIELRSLAPQPLSARAHVMFMHNQTGTHIDGAAFIDLGRTDTRIGHTVPKLSADGTTEPGTDLNTIGRYPVHFHIRSGALLSVPPHVVRRSVVINSPKFGIVNHGGHVLVEDNVTFRVHGSHIVAENGSEVGTFRGNMMVRSAGSRDLSILSRMGIYDNAHSGNGIWLTSGGIEVIGNWASGHADSGLKMLAMAFREGDREVFFDAKNLGLPKYADAEGRVRLMDVTLKMKGNMFLASNHGMGLWNHKELEGNDEDSTIENTAIWSVRSAAVQMPYTRNVALRGLRLWGIPAAEAIGVDGNHITGNLTFDGGSIEGFDIGLRVPRQGNNVIRGMLLANRVDIDIPSASLPERYTLLDRLHFSSESLDERIFIRMGHPEIPFSGKPEVLFSNDTIYLVSLTGEGRRLYFPWQAADAIPFSGSMLHRFKGLTAEQIRATFDLTLGGELAPPNATPLPYSNAVAVVASVNEPISEKIGSAAYIGSIRHELYDPHFANFGGDGLRKRSSDISYKMRLALGATVPEAPAFFLHPSLLPRTIHPDDVKFGYRILGYLADNNYGRIRIVSHFEDFKDLVVDPDGIVRVAPGMFGNDVRTLEIHVTPNAVRRGPNLDWFMQAEYCGSCGFGEVEEKARQVLDGKIK